ncbi:tetrahydromethanopterin S-methyltransferase subunit B [Bacillus mesophilus]|uniref:DUF1640 domain-containing protein n=1 Tax=Bacillus mesophilus TaxID=1808955 RepID=A0A6M0Q7R6_9BACI|nr:hypothetical protein [Bacillus mesophilus]MBM7660926.1 tetrahydromethanopterin S-methyltransferase subunit B [Bacillus mesophilus]NEY71530.1 hypothetical protein [Bacillus mesophilus]
MEELELKVKELEMKIDELESLQENYQESLTHSLDENDVHALVDELIAEKELITQADLEKSMSKAHLQMIKWVVGTGISSVALLLGLLRIFM